MEISELSRMEAVLFLAREPVPGRKLAQLADLPEGVRIRSKIRELNQRYEKDASAFCVVDVAGGFQLRTCPEFAPWLFRMQEVPVEVRLTNAAMETLATIAYEQPVLRSRIESVRGVQCGEILRQLLEQDLIRIAGRSEELGRPFLYGTTKRFLQMFGLVHINALTGNNFSSSEEAVPSEEKCSEEEKE